MSPSSFRAQVPESQIPNSQPRGLGLTLKSNPHTQKSQNTSWNGLNEMDFKHNFQNFNILSQKLSDSVYTDTVPGLLCRVVVALCGQWQARAQVHATIRILIIGNAPRLANTNIAPGPGLGWPSFLPPTRPASILEHQSLALGGPGAWGWRPDGNKIRVPTSLTALHLG